MINPVLIPLIDDCVHALLDRVNGNFPVRFFYHDDGYLSGEALFHAVFGSTHSELVDCSSYTYQCSTEMFVESMVSNLSSCLYSVYMFNPNITVPFNWINPTNTDVSGKGLSSAQQPSLVEVIPEVINNVRVLHHVQVTFLCLLQPLEKTLSWVLRVELLTLLPLTGT